MNRNYGHFNHDTNRLIYAVDKARFNLPDAT